MKKAARIENSGIFRFNHRLRKFPGRVNLPLLLTENHVDAGYDQTSLRERELVYQFGKQTTVERYDLRNVGNRVLG